MTIEIHLCWLKVGIKSPNHNGHLSLKWDLDGHILTNNEFFDRPQSFRNQASHWYFGLIPYTSNNKACLSWRSKCFVILQDKNEYKGCHGIRNTSFVGRYPIKKISDLICRKGLISDFGRNLDPLGHTACNLSNNNVLGYY